MTKSEPTTCTSWGQYPSLQCRRFRFNSEAALLNILSERENLIPRGNGRSYGDSALSEHVVDVKYKNCLLAFDDDTGVLHLQAGVLLSEILDTFVPRGWFLKVTPGTKWITVGGAIASDVHGKNHHIAGCFSESVLDFRMMLASGEVVTCSRQSTPELFMATCGGMGLTGIILDAQIQLQRIQSSFLDQTTVKTANLEETFDAFESNSTHSYSVAWIDCLAKGHQLGRGLLSLGEFRQDGELQYSQKPLRTMPFHLPSFALNKWSVGIFNQLHLHKQRKNVAHQVVDLDHFFYPLDTIGKWNRIYGKKGFVQYQFILPKVHSFEGLTDILRVIADAGKGSFLAVLKLYGEANDNWLSFPIQGYSLALDFRVEPGLFDLLNKLDTIVTEYQGRIYLTKDSRISETVFEKGYPNIDKFRQFRRDNQMTHRFQSYQSRRVRI